MDNVGIITFNNCPVTSINPYGKLETIEKVWLFESGNFYEAADIKNIYISELVAVSHIPATFKLMNYLTKDTTHYEDSIVKRWIAISEKEIEKE